MRAYIEILDEAAYDILVRFVEVNKFTLDQVRICPENGVLSLSDAINSLAQPCWPSEGPYPDEQRHPLQKKGLTQKEHANYHDNCIVSMMRRAGCKPGVRPPAAGQERPLDWETVEKLFCLALLQEDDMELRQRLLERYNDYKDRRDEVMAEIEGTGKNGTPRTED